jgi:hypothetical protein
MANDAEPEWMARLRAAAKQRPRTQFHKVRWSDLQQLLRVRDLLAQRADASTLELVRMLEEAPYGLGPKGDWISREDDVER